MREPSEESKFQEGFTNYCITHAVIINRSLLETISKVAALGLLLIALAFYFAALYVVRVAR